MKKSHILIIVVIAAAIGIIITTAGDASTYVNFDQAYELATAGNKKDIHVVGTLKKDGSGQVIGIEEGADSEACGVVANAQQRPVPPHER